MILRKMSRTLLGKGRLISSLCRWGFVRLSLRSSRPKIKVQNHSCLSSLSPCWIEGFFHIQKCSLTRYTEVYLRAEPSTVMAAPELRIAVRFYSTRNILFWQDLYSHRKNGNIAGFPLCINYCIFSSLWINFKSSPFVLRKVFSS